MRLRILTSPLIAGWFSTDTSVTADMPRTVKLAVTIDRGADIGQNFGSLFEATSDDDSLVIGAGF